MAGKKDDNDDICCSFCGKSQEYAKKLISGPNGVYICDECIRQVSDIIRQTILRNTDTICRLDGGRFIAFMEGGSDMEPVALAEKVRANVERKRIPHGRRAANPFVTVSIGVASCIPRYENSFTELYDEAEDALFEAKERGRNVTVYDEQVYGNYSRKAN